MINWNQYKDFSPKFLENHRDLVLFDVYHHIKAFLLFSPNCSCKPICFCKEQREKVIVTLNTDLYNQALSDEESPEVLYAIKVILRIPEDHWFRENQCDLYPLWLFEQELHKKESSHHFKMVDRLVWTLLRLAQSYKLSIFRESRASLKEAIERILGSAPLKTNVENLKKNDYFGGEKAYASRFNEYKSVCHFIAAFIYMEQMIAQRGPSLLTLKNPKEIEQFLSIAHWFRNKLLCLETPNVKERHFLSDQILIPLPDGITSDAVNIPIEPYQDIIERIEAQLNDPKNRVIPERN